MNTNNIQINNGKDLFNYLEKDKNISLKKRICTNPNYEIFDTKFSKRHLEDQLYEKYIFYRNYLTRGLSFIKNLKTNEIKILRRGLNKFFELKDDIQIENINEIYFTKKENGENAQISYDLELNKFIICSKNVAMTIKDLDEINEFKANTEYNFCIKIALIFFEKIKNINENSLEELKNFLNDKTIIAEYVGDINTIHLEVYKELDIIFYSIVNKDIIKKSNKIDLLNYLKKFNLTIISFEKNIENNLEKELINRKKFIGERSILEKGEGEVVYIYDKENNLINIFKIKTAEYSIFRFFREKLKLLKKDKFNNNKLKIRIKEYLIEKSKKYNLPQNIDLYYLSFKYMFSIHKILSKNNIFLNKFILLCLYVNSFLKNNKLFDSFNNDLYFEKEKFNYLENMINTEFNIFDKKFKYVNFIIPNLIPCSGKSTYFKTSLEKILLKNGFDLFTFSSDTYLNNEIQNQKVYDDQIIKKLRFISNEKMKKDIMNLITNNEKNIIFIYIDKNNPPNSLKLFNDIIEKNKNVLFNRIALYDKNTNFLFKNTNFDYNLLISNIYRIYHMKEHLTLNNNDFNENIKVLLEFLNYYTSNFDRDQINNNFYSQSWDIQLNNKSLENKKELIDLMNNIYINYKKKIDFSNDILELINLLKKSDFDKLEKENLIVMENDIEKEVDLTLKISKLIFKMSNLVLPNNYSIILNKESKDQINKMKQEYKFNLNKFKYENNYKIILDEFMNGFEKNKNFNYNEKEYKIETLYIIYIENCILFLVCKIENFKEFNYILLNHLKMKSYEAKNILGESIKNNFKTFFYNFKNKDHKVIIEKFNSKLLRISKLNFN